MTAVVKAIVFKTERLAASRLFFEKTLQLQVKESSARHFVIHSKGVRLVFVESPGDFGVEIYINENRVPAAGAGSSGSTNNDVAYNTDPNGISIVIT